MISPHRAQVLFNGTIDILSPSLYICNGVSVVMQSSLRMDCGITILPSLSILIFFTVIPLHMLCIHYIMYMSICQAGK